MEGKIFDVRRFSVHDGCGIRTTVFFKGCPLHCVWCQNPEGIDPEIEMYHFASRCIACGACLQDPPGAVLQKGSSFLIHAEKMQGNEAFYENLCPTGALCRNARCCTVQDLLRDLLKDRVFFAHGGGVTLSGGEPFFQPDFMQAILEALTAAKVHTAVESSLYTEYENIARALPYIDQLFADCKIFSREKHRQATGVFPDKIFANIEKLLQLPERAKVTIRTPLIPGYTASEENIAAIAGWISAIDPEVSYELLNYNPLAAAKYVHGNRRYAIKKETPLYTREEMAFFCAVAQRAGARNVFVES